MQRTISIFLVSILISISLIFTLLLSSCSEKEKKPKTKTDPTALVGRQGKKAEAEAAAKAEELAKKQAAKLKQAKQNGPQYKCYIRLQKGFCWREGNKFSTTVKVYNAINDKYIQTIKLGKNGAEQMFEFPCDVAKHLTFQAQFKPAIFEGNEKQVYEAKTIWPVPQVLPNDTEKWVVDLCFSTDFINVPKPVTKEFNCGCKFTPLEANAQRAKPQ